MTRRTMLGVTGGLAGAGLFGLPAFAQASQAFSFEWLTETMRARAGAPYEEPEHVGGRISELTYDEYRLIQVVDGRARLGDTDGKFRLLPYHVGWLFEEPVTIFEVEDGQATPVAFTTADFRYPGDLGDRITEDGALPGVAGFRLNFPLNDAEKFDETISFLGASYFRALGMGNVYGLSARGLAVNSGLSGGEEFPRFASFWIERPSATSQTATIYAALDSPSVTGAYRFVIDPGRTTVVDVDARLFFREAVDQIGIAPLTSMFFYGPNDMGPFDDYRPRVHDSEILLVDAGDSRFVRPLRNPPRMASSYLGATNPSAFGLVQRARGFDDYLDAGAHYDRRPSLLVEPRGDWGTGSVRLVEFPTDVESNDNIVAFWVPETQPAAGDALEYSYRLDWGTDVVPARSDLAQITRTLAGAGGVGGIKPRTDRRKFVIDFAGGRLAEPSLEDGVQENVSVSGGEITETILERIGPDLWRLVIEVTGDPGSVVELRALLMSETARLSETWLCQWMPE